MTELDSSRMFISYATPYDLYKGTLDWNELMREQQDRVLRNEISADADGVSDFIMETGLKKCQAGGIRSILIAASMRLERHRRITNMCDWTPQKQQMVLKFLDGTLFAKRLTEALDPTRTQERTPLNGEMLSAVSQTNKTHSVFDVTLDMNFVDAQRFILDHMEKTPELKESIQHQRKVAEAEKVIDQINKLKTIHKQKRLMAAYYEDVPKPPKLTSVERLNALPRQVKAALIAILFWSAYVVYRTYGDHTFLGEDINQWSGDGDDFLVNWLTLPILLAVGFFSWRWVIADTTTPKPQKSYKSKSAEKQFANDLAAWPDEQHKLVIELLKLVYEQDHKSIFLLIPQIENNILDRAIEYIRVMKKPPHKNAYH